MPPADVAAIEERQRDLELRIERLVGALEANTQAVSRYCAVLDGVDEKPGLRTRVALLEDTALRQKWIMGILATGLVGLIVRLAVVWIASGR